MGDIFNRKIYNKVKKMDRQQMEDYIKEVYRQGFADGSGAGNKADFRIALSDVLTKTKGVGEKTYDKIMQAAKEMLA